MYKKVAIIPMRSGSKGVPKKNIKDLNGIPLFLYSVNTALDSDFDRIIINTDFTNLNDYDIPDKVEIFYRNKNLSGDDVLMEEVLLQMFSLLGLNSETIVLLQPTSPLRTSNNIKNALDLFYLRKCNLLISVSEVSNSLLKSGYIIDDKFKAIDKTEYLFMNRQYLPSVYRPNGAIYIFNSDWFVKNSGFNTDNISAFIMSKEDSIDIDKIEDFENCAKILNKRDLLI